MITDPDSLNDGVEIQINTSSKTILLSATGNLDQTGCQLQALYSKLKELWKSNANYIRFPFPLLAITEEKFEIQNGWDWANVATKLLIRTGGWALKDLNSNTVEEWAGVITLGNIDAGGQIYYTQSSSATSGTNFNLTGAVNQAVQVYLSGTYDYRSNLTLYIREYLKSYDNVNLGDIGVTTMTYQVYRFPLANGNDVKITHSDAHVTSATPYSAMSITWYDTPQPKTMGVNTYNFHVIVDANNGTAEQVYEYVQKNLRSSADIDASSATHNGKVTNELLYFVGDTLYSRFNASDALTSGGVYIINFQSTDTNRLVFTDDTGNTRTFPYVAVLTLQFGENLQTDTSAIYRVFFTNDNAGDNTGRDFGTSGAIIVKDNLSADMIGNVSGTTSVQLTYDYDGNIQRGIASSATEAPVTVVAIGLNTAQYVNATGTIARSISNNISLVAALERNFNNPA
jgi:hypothetical protein